MPASEGGRGATPIPYGLRDRQQSRLEARAKISTELQVISEKRRINIVYGGLNKANR